MKSSLSVNSPLGPLTLVEEDGALIALLFGPAPGPMQETPLLREAASQLAEYFAGARRAFDLPLAPAGTAFQRRVWQQLAKVPYGTVISYGELARQAGSPRGARAAGMACHRNPLPVFLPCHRVVGAGGALTGYAGGLQCKIALLALEGIHLVPSSKLSPKDRQNPEKPEKRIVFLPGVCYTDPVL